MLIKTSLHAQNKPFAGSSITAEQKHYKGTVRLVDQLTDQQADTPSCRVVAHDQKACALILICCYDRKWSKYRENQRAAPTAIRAQTLFNESLNLDPVWRKLSDSMILLHQNLQEGHEQLGKIVQTTARKISCINNIALSTRSRLRDQNSWTTSNQTSGKRSSRFLKQYLKLRCSSPQE